MTRLFDVARLWALLLMLAGTMAVYHPGARIHRDGIVTFPNGMKLDKDHAMLTVAAGCAPGSECSFARAVMLPYGAQFSNTEYSCAANQTGGQYLYPGLLFECYPLSPFSFALAFHNATSTDLSGVQLDISFSALGM